MNIFIKYLLTPAILFFIYFVALSQQILMNNFELIALLTQ